MLNIEKFILNNDLILVNINKKINLKELAKIPNLYVKNIKIINCPTITSLEGLPSKIDGDFICINTKIKNLKGSPQEGIRNFYCTHCDELESLIGAPERINGIFDCSYNRRLTNLNGSPQRGISEFYCRNCNLLSFDGAPYKIDGNFDFSQNTNIMSLKGLTDIGIRKFIFGNSNSSIGISNLPTINRYQNNNTPFEEYDTRQLIIIAKFHEKGIFDKKKINIFLY